MVVYNDRGEPFEFAPGMFVVLNGNEDLEPSSDGARVIRVSAARRRFKLTSLIAPVIGSLLVWIAVAIPYPSVIFTCCILSFMLGRIDERRRW